MYLPFTLLSLLVVFEKSAGDSAFNLKIDFLNVDSSSREFFNAAAAKWSSVVIGDIPDVRIPMVARLLVRNNACHARSKTWPLKYDDLYICGAHISIDGVGTILGQAGPLFARRGSKGLPFAGLMEFDIADVEYLISKGIYKEVILHEMGRVLGIGTLWNRAGLTGSSKADPPCPYLNNSYASREYQALSGCPSAARTEVDYPTRLGTQCGHWEESCFQGELMTGFATGNLTLSRVTVGTLQDLGYTVNYDAADPFTVNDLNASCTCTGGNRLRKQRILQETARLSQDGQQRALDYGRSILLANQKLYRPLFDKMQSKMKGVEYLGDQYVSIIVREGDNVFTVDVTSDDL